MKSFHLVLCLSFFLMASCGSESPAERSQREAKDLTNELLDELESESDTIPSETTASMVSKDPEDSPGEKRQLK